jgi:hypothetical protein
MQLALRTSLSIALVLAAACTAPTVPVDEEHTATRGARIIGGTVAKAYPEAVLVDMLQGGQLAAACSGALVAPRLVLTAGHCVHGYDGWQITAPYAGGATSGSTKGEVLDWTDDSGTVDPGMHDVAVIFLDQPIALPSYPEIAKAPVADGTHVVNIGRIRDGQFSDSDLYVSKPVAVGDGAPYGFPFDYASPEIIQSGDSGGPDEVLTGGVHTIVAVNSGGGQGTQVLARTDLVASWIGQQIAASGGSPDPGAGGADPGGVGGAGPGPDPDPDPGPGPDPDPGPGPDPGPCPASCAGLDFVGTCEGDVLRYCELGFAFEVDCAMFGATCGLDPSLGLHDCM